MTETVPAPGRLPTQRQRPLDPPDELSRLRAEQPISRLAYPDGHLGWLVTSHAAGRRILSDQRFSGRGDLKKVPFDLPSGARPWTTVPPGWFIHMDPPDHTKYRSLLTGQFTVRRIKQLEPRIEEVAAEHLDAMERHGPPVDLVQAFALPIPSLVICELLGVPYAERPHFQGHSLAVMRLDSTAEQIAAAFQAISALIFGLVQRKRAEPADDLMSGLISTGQLNDQELTGIAMMMLMAGHETTASMLSLGTYTLLRHPDQLARLREDPALFDGAVEELMRFLTIAQFGVPRTALEDVEIDGQVIRAGDAVTVSLPAANRDPERFDDPDELDVTRRATGHMAFGYGIHQCLGQQLARSEMRIAYAALFRRFPALRLAVPAEEVPMRTGASMYAAQELPVTW
ncbi:cytochrome P450 [Micromonospora sp. NPDC048898]|uniref:cytochrome P450 n=1 Tax=Micromonospora sp. NPDC048898 TaxID=3364260 RepID=UPI0037212621